MMREFFVVTAYAGGKFWQVWLALATFCGVGAVLGARHALKRAAKVTLPGADNSRTFIQAIALGMGTGLMVAVLLTIANWVLPMMATL